MTSNSIANLLRFHDESTLRDRIRTSLTDWAVEVLASSGQTPSIHQRFLLTNLEMVAKGEIKRLMVLMPPGSAKSTYCSVVFPVWWFTQHPRTSIIAASHTAALVEHFSRRVHGLIEEHRHKLGLRLMDNHRAAGNWRTTTGGEYFAAGVRGGIAGRRADLAIIDDPVKSMAEAESARQRQYIWDWYNADLTPRLKPDARIVLVMTRWHEQDLGGQLLSRDGEGWTVLRLPALAESRDPIGRPPGAPLWPEWESLEALSKKREMVGSRVWSALFQQSPQPPGERHFRVQSIGLVSREEAIRFRPVRTVRAWDLAATAADGQHNPDWTVGLRLTLEEGGRYIVEDIVRIRDNSIQIRDMIVATARTDGHAVLVSLPIDPGQAGKAQIAQLTSTLAGYRVYASREQGSKLSRALPVAAQIEAGNFLAVRGEWLRPFFEELAEFPQGAKDDQVDALSRAFLTLSDAPGGARQVFIPFNMR